MSTLLTLAFLTVVNVEPYLTEWRLFFSLSPVEVYLSNDMPDVDDIVGQQCRKAHAYCDMWSGKIVLNEHFWRTGNYWQKKKVLYHELGHCHFNLQHPQNPYEYTIMNSYLETANSDGSNWGELLEELRRRIHMVGKEGVEPSRN